MMTYELQQTGGVSVGCRLACSTRIKAYRATYDTTSLICRHALDRSACRPCMLGVGQNRFLAGLYVFEAYVVDTR